jgi:hypothetical protein
MIIAANVGQNMGVVMPEVEDVRKDVNYGWPGTRTGTLDPGSSPPSKPIITGVVDNGDQDSVTVSITTTPGTNTVQLYYRQTSLSAWVTGETRTGSGDIVQTGLVAGTWYEMYATANNPNESAPSNMVTIYLAQAAGVGTLKSAIYTILMGDATVLALTDGQITPGGDPTRGASSVTYHKITRVGESSMDGPDTYVTPRMQVNSYAKTDYLAEQLSDAVRGALNGFSGTVNGVAIQYIHLEDEGDLDDYEANNKEISRHGVRQDYEISYQEL